MIHAIAEKQQQDKNMSAYYISDTTLNVLHLLTQFYNSPKR